MYIASFDIGKKNFAFCIEKCDHNELYGLNPIRKTIRYVSDGSCSNDMIEVLNKVCINGEIILIKNVDLTTNCKQVKTFDQRILINLTRVLTDYRKYWDMCQIFIIEQQMCFGKKRNPTALRIAQHCYSFFIIQYASFKTIIDFPSYHKTRVFGASKKYSKYERKKWSIEKAIHILQERDDSNTLQLINESKKKDDLSDIIVQLQSFKYLYFVEKNNYV